MKQQRALLAWIAAAVTVLSISFGVLCATASSSESLIMGDLNRNGCIDSKDARLMLFQIIDNRSFDELHAKQADLSGDGKVNTMDVHLVLKWMADGVGATAPTITTTTTATTTVATTTTTKPSIDDDGYYDDVVKP